MTDTLDEPSETLVLAARVELLDRLAAAGYGFVTPTPSTHRLVAGRRDRARPGNLRDIFGWGLPFIASDLDDDLFRAMRAAQVLDPQAKLFRSRVRVSALDGALHLHSARSASPDAVFLGPDSYRFVRFLDAAVRDSDAPRTILDIGAGAGAGALALARRFPEAQVAATDVNPLALEYLAANAAHARLLVTRCFGAGLEAAPAGAYDLIVANPPYIADPEDRTYRNGGGALGSDLALRWVETGLGRLAPGGRFALYTGSPIVEGRDLLKGELQRLAAARDARLTYEELDPDVFGGALRQPAYHEVERIAAVGAVLSR